MNPERRTAGPSVVERREEAEIALAREIADLVRARPTAVLGFATGDTPSGVYRELARLRRDEGLDFSRATAFGLDEYLGLPADHPASFARWLRERVFEPLGIPPGNVHGLSCDTRADPAERCREYEQEITDAGGIDLQILGIGRNGHVAFNEPGSPRASRTRVVDLHPATREDAAATFGGLDLVPRTAATMGIATILAARSVRVLAFGVRKAAVVRRAMEDPIGPDVPATFLREHADVRVWLDRAAAGELGAPAELRARA